MSEDQFKPDDFNAYVCDNAIVTDIEGNLEIVARMFDFILESALFPATFSIDTEQGKTRVIFEE